MALDEETIRESFEQAEPPQGTIAWAQSILSRYEPLVSGPAKDIARVYEAPYLEAAAILSIGDSVAWEGLGTKLKNAVSALAIGTSRYASAHTASETRARPRRRPRLRSRVGSRRAGKN